MHIGLFKQKGVAVFEEYLATVDLTVVGLPPWHNVARRAEPLLPCPPVATSCCRFTTVAAQSQYSAPRRRLYCRLWNMSISIEYCTLPELNYRRLVKAATRTGYLCTRPPSMSISFSIYSTLLVRS
jgi:hypothetical protein